MSHSMRWPTEAGSSRAITAAAGDQGWPSDVPPWRLARDAVPVSGQPAGGDEQGLARLVHVAGMPDPDRVDNGLPWQHRDRTVPRADLLDDVAAAGQQEHHFVAAGVALPVSPCPLDRDNADEPPFIAVLREVPHVTQNALPRP